MIDTRPILEQIKSYKDNVIDIYKDHIAEDPNRFAKEISEQCVSIDVETLKVIFKPDLVDLCLTLYPI